MSDAKQSTDIVKVALILMFTLRKKYGEATEKSDIFNRCNRHIQFLANTQC